jgi:hypothetical protein
MLEALGIIAPKYLERDGLLETLYSRCPEQVSRALRRYGQQLLKRGGSAGGHYKTIRTVAEFQIWLSKNEPALDLLTASQDTVLRYLNALNDRDRSGIRRRALNRFYRWAQLEKVVLMNPAKTIPVPKLSRSMGVLADQQIREIESFVKNPNSDPEFALVLALVLYWGLTAMELALSTIEIHDGEIWIYLYRRQLGSGRKSHNRDQVLKIPKTPAWLEQLQARYLRVWQERFARARKSFPYQPLILGRSAHNRSNRPRHASYALRLF